jgi:hypothetical protein
VLHRLHITSIKLLHVHIFSFVSVCIHFHLFLHLCSLSLSLSDSLYLHLFVLVLKLFRSFQFACVRSRTHILVCECSYLPAITSTYSCMSVLDMELRPQNAGPGMIMQFIFSIDTYPSSFPAMSCLVARAPGTPERICLPTAPPPETDANANTDPLSHLSQAHSITHTHWHACTQSHHCTHAKDSSSKNMPTNHPVLTA